MEQTSSPKQEERKGNVQERERQPSRCYDCDGECSCMGVPRFRRSSAMASIAFKLFSSTGFVRTLWEPLGMFNDDAETDVLIYTSIEILLLVGQ